MAINTKDIQIFKAFCDENRLQIMESLRSGEKCACKLLEELKIGQSTLSHHMKILCDSGIVVGRKDGKWVHYRIDPAGCETAKARLAVLTSCSTDGESSCACRTSQQADQ